MYWLIINLITIHFMTLTGSHFLINLYLRINCYLKWWSCRTLSHSPRLLTLIFFLFQWGKKYEKIQCEENKFIVTLGLWIKFDCV